MSCVLEENVSVVIIDNQKVEVHECDESSTGGGKGTGGGGSNGGLPNDGTGNYPSSPTGNSTPTEDCSLFAGSLKHSCTGLPAADQALCEYNACVAGATCLGEGAAQAQCGTKPKGTPHPNETACFNRYAANFNACTVRFRTPSGQNSCLYASGSSLHECMTGAGH
jgi:hypothetical protein